MCSCVRTPYTQLMTVNRNETPHVCEVYVYRCASKRTHMHTYTHACTHTHTHMKKEGREEAMVLAILVGAGRRKWQCV